MWLALLASSVAADWSLADRDVSWPLCGRITESPPPGWVQTDGCPADRANAPAHTDMPLSGTYGPRRKASEAFRYDWHRGIDVPTPCGTPLYAIAEGTVQLDGVSSAYGDAVLRVRHSDGPACTGGCYHSEFIHVAESAVAVGEVVERGQLLGWSGFSGIGQDMSLDRFAKCSAPHAGFDHLHMDIREAPAWDVYSTWSRDAVHPLLYLPYEDSGRAASSLSLTLDRTGLWTQDVTVHIEMPIDELDLAAVDVEIYARRGARNVQRLVDPGAVADSQGYVIRPPWLDFGDWNFTLSHKDSSAYDWDGWYSQCPWVAEHPPSYDAATHVDLADPNDPHTGAFNGLRIAPASFSTASATWRLDVTFEGLLVPAPANSCVLAWVTDVSGNRSFVVDNCPRRARCTGGYADSRACVP